MSKRIFRAEAGNVDRATTVGSLWRRFRHDRSGATAVAFALTALPVLLSMGGGIDMFQAWRMRLDLQDAVDSGVLAGSVKADETGDTETAKVAANTFIKQAFDTPYGVTSTKTTAVDSAKSIIKTTASVEMKTSFLKLIGKSTINVSASAAATYGGQLMQVSIALDVTGSMVGSRITAAKAAAKDLTQTLFTVPGTNKKNDKVKIAVVPFAEYVNIGTSSRGQPWLDVANDSSWQKYECWEEEQGAYCAASRKIYSTCYNDGMPYPCSWDECTNWVPGTKVNKCRTNTYSTEWHGCVGSRSGAADLQAAASSASKVPGLMDAWCNETLLRLTDNQGTVISKIEGLWLSGATYIAPGVLWAWRTLSSSAPFADGAANGKTTKKAIVLMTDGANTVSSTAPWHWGSDVNASNDTLAKTCANAKADDITIFTIAFEVTDTKIKQILKACASAEPYFYDSNNAQQMKDAFKKIGAQLTARRLVY